MLAILANLPQAGRNFEFMSVLCSEMTSLLSFSADPSLLLTLLNLFLNLNTNLEASEVVEWIDSFPGVLEVVFRVIDGSTGDFLPHSSGLRTLQALELLLALLNSGDVYSDEQESSIPNPILKWLEGKEVKSQSNANPLSTLSSGRSPKACIQDLYELESHPESGMHINSIGGLNYDDYKGRYKEEILKRCDELINRYLFEIECDDDYDE